MVSSLHHHGLPLGSSSLLSIIAMSRYIYGSVGQEQLAAFYRDASVGLITPLRDGMNLVAKVG